MPKVLITGGAGFIGSHLCDRYIREGYDVVAMDNLLTGSKDNIAHLFAHPAFEFHYHDVTTFVHVPGPLDLILHFASPASPADYLSMPIQTLKVGSLGTHNLLGLAKEKGSRVVIASTSEVYGDPKVHPQTEDYWGHVNPIGPRGVYDEAKRFMEAMTMAYHTYHDLNTGIVRIFNTYGPRMRLDDGRVIPNFMAQAVRGDALTIYGDGSQTRSFCYVDDLVDGIFRLANSSYHMPVNIGNPSEISVLDFVSEMKEISGKPELQVVFEPLPVNDPKRRRPDISLAKEVLGWEPSTDRATGMKATYEYFEAILT